MVSRSQLAILLLLGVLSAVHAQSPRRWETREPPLAGADGSIKQTSGQEPQAPPPIVRTTDAPAPLVRVFVAAPTVVAAGQEMGLKLVVENVSRVPAHDVVVRYKLPDGAAFVKAEPPPAANDLAWNLGTLVPGGRSEVPITIRLPAGANDIEHRAKVTVAHEHVARTRMTTPSLAVRKFGPAQAQLHDVLIFALDVTNSGGMELTDVKVTDELPEGLEYRPHDDRLSTAGQYAVVLSEPRKRSWSIARIPPGQTRRIEYHVQAQKIGTIAHGGSAVAGAARAEAIAQKVAIRDLALEIKASAPAREAANRVARVTVSLRNLSPKALDNVVVVDALQQSCKLDAITAGGQYFDPNRVQWIVQALRPNETRVMELAVRNPTGGPVRHQFTATYRGMTKAAEAVTEFDASAALKWDVRSSTATVEINGEVTYTVSIQNVGSGPASNVRPGLTLPAELGHLQSTPQMHKVDGQRVLFDPVTIPAGGEFRFEVRARALRATLGARTEVELLADVYSSGPVRKHVMTAVGGS